VDSVSVAHVCAPKLFDGEQIHLETELYLSVLGFNPHMLEGGGDGGVVVVVMVVLDMVVVVVGGGGGAGAVVVVAMVVVSNVVVVDATGVVFDATQGGTVCSMPFGHLVPSL